MTNQYIELPSQDFGSVMSNYGSEGNINRDLLQLLDATDIVEAIEHRLRGERWSPKEQLWVTVDTPWVNQEGATRISGVIGSRLNIIFSISNFDTQDVNRLCLELCEEIGILLEMNCSKWELDPTYLTSIGNLLDHMFFAILSQAKNDGTRRMLSGAYHINETRRVDDRQERMANIINPFSNNGG